MARSRSYSAAERSPLADFSMGALTVSVLVGILFFVVNFPNLIRNRIVPSIESEFIRNLLTGLVSSVESGIAQFVGQPAVSFRTLMALNFLGFFLYLLLIVVWSGLRFRPLPLVTTAIGLAVGLYAVHLLSWFILGSIWAAGIAMTVLASIYAAVAWLIRFIFSDALAFTIFLAVVVYLWINRANLLAAIVVPCVLVALGFAAYYLLPQVFAFLLAIVTAVWTLIADLLRPVLQFIAWLLSPVIWLVQLIANYIIAPLLGFIVALLAVLIPIAAILLVSILLFGTMGHVVTDQIRSAFRVRHGGRNFLLNGFALGSALALVTLASVAAPRVSAGIADGWLDSLQIVSRMTGLGVDSGWPASIDFTKLFVATMPGAVHEFVQQHLTLVQPPIVDAALLFVLLVASSANVAIGILSRGTDMKEGRAITFLSMEVTLIVLFLVAGIFILFAQAASEGN